MEIGIDPVYFRRWMLSFQACQANAFGMTFLGTVNIQNNGLTTMGGRQKLYFIGYSSPYLCPAPL